MWQARSWLPLPIGSVNLGLYRTEVEAHIAVKNWIKAGGDPCLGLPHGILPKWVVRGEGCYLAVLRTRKGERIVLRGEFETPESAHHAARREVARRLGKKKGALKEVAREAVARYFQRSLFEAWE